MRDFKELEIWADSHQFVLKIYLITKSYPDHEKFGIISQMRRSASSMPMNISEGCGRSGDKELKRSCEMSMGSASELEYQLILSHDLDYLSSAKYEELVRELVILKKRMNSFIQYLKKRIDGDGA
ncbi:MAG: four helix bundle protein [Marinoscillum sp.]